ncbi:hypothetical protein F5X98DRAFT_359147 [Xylaria grammica]|nr:hypothetical protein F5X98DRAFT_359147 [Xylaria grammica]
MAQPPAISFRHPGYPASARDLLRLSATDGEPAHGIDYNIALAACGIVACNRWRDAWFGEERDAGGGEEAQDRYRRVPRPENGILPYKETPYYFFVGDDVGYKYPVVPSFAHWPFPHDGMPDDWRTLQFPSGSATAVTLPEEPRSALYARDQGCRVTGYFLGSDIARLVPAQATGWFEANGMQRYCQLQTRANPIDDEANTLVLRQDICKILGEGYLGIVPRAGAQPTAQAQTDGQQAAAPVTPIPSTPPNTPMHSNQATYPVIHVFIPDEYGELLQIYHNQPLQPSCPGAASDIAPEFLFARFAWAVLSDKHYNFLQCGWLEYRVLILDPETGERREQDMGREALGHSVRLFSERSGSSEASEASDDDEEPGENDDDDSPGQYEESARGRSRWRVPATLSYHVA